MTLLEKAKASMGVVERAISGLPGVRDYREKELRREADRRLRQRLARRLESSRRKLTSLQRDLVSAGQLRALPEMERAVGRIQLLIDRIKTAASGYAGFFDAEKVREEELQQIIDFDESIAQRIPKINEHIDALNQAIQTGEGYDEALDALMNTLNELHEQFDQRQEAIHAAAE
jgi:DNA repair exonuclease SbcCD ATPase subunit